MIVLFYWLVQVEMLLYSEVVFEVRISVALIRDRLQC